MAASSISLLFSREVQCLPAAFVVLETTGALDGSTSSPSVSSGAICLACLASLSLLLHHLLLFPSCLFCATSGATYWLPALLAFAICLVFRHLPSLAFCMQYLLQLNCIAIGCIQLRVPVSTSSSLISHPAHLIPRICVRWYHFVQEVNSKRDKQIATTALMARLLLGPERSALGCDRSLEACRVWEDHRISQLSDAVRMLPPTQRLPANSKKLSRELLLAPNSPKACLQRSRTAWRASMIRQTHAPLRPRDWLRAPDEGF